MRDENDTNDRRKLAAEAAERPDGSPLRQGEGAPAFPDQYGEPDRPAGAGQPAQDDYRAAQMPPLAAQGMHLDDTLDEIPGFLRRCAKETSAQQEGRDGAQDAPSRPPGGGLAPADRREAGQNAAAPAGGATSAPVTVGKYGTRIATGARLRGELGSPASQMADQAGEEQSDWSNSARGALNELLADIDDENARRISNRDQFAALAVKRRTTWPLTALIVSFLLVVLAYSARNVDASGAPAAVWRNAWALVVGPPGDPGDSGAMTAGQTAAREAEVAAAPPSAPAPQPAARTPDIDQTAPRAMAPPVPTAAPQPVAPSQPPAPPKATGLVFEPVKIVEPLGRAKVRTTPTRRQIAAPTPAPTATPAPQTQPAVAAAPAPAPAPALPQAPSRVQGNAAATVAAAPVHPAAPAARTPPRPQQRPSPTSTTTALAPSVPAASQGSPDKMPLASLAISPTAFAPTRDVAAAQLKRVASVVPSLVGAGAEPQGQPARAPIRQQGAVAAPAPANPTFKLSARTPPPPARRQVPLPASPDPGGTNAMLSRAENLLVSRDIASARLLFERAARYGSAQGAFGAAQTYDPVSFEKLGVYGVPAEPKKAIVLYQKAIDGGHPDAARYLESLNAWLRSAQGRNSTAQR